MKFEKILYIFAGILIVLGPILHYLGKESKWYLPLAYIGAGLAVIATILIVKNLIKKLKK